MSFQCSGTISPSETAIPAGRKNFQVSFSEQNWKFRIAVLASSDSPFATHSCTRVRGPPRRATLVALHVSLRAQRLKKSRSSSRIEVFKRDWKFQASHAPSPIFWVHANGGIINGGTACVGAKWRVFVHFASFCVFLCVSVRFILPKWPAKKRKFAQNPAKMCKKRFYAVPPLVIPPFACHRIFLVGILKVELDMFKRDWSFHSMQPRAVIQRARARAGLKIVPAESMAASASRMLANSNVSTIKEAHIGERREKVKKNKDGRQVKSIGSCSIIGSRGSIEVFKWDCKFQVRYFQDLDLKECP